MCHSVFVHTDVTCAYSVFGQKVPSIWHASEKNRYNWNGKAIWAERVNDETSSARTKISNEKYWPESDMDGIHSNGHDLRCLHRFSYSIHILPLNESQHLFQITKNSPTIEHDLQKWKSKDFTQFLHTMSKKYNAIYPLCMLPIGISFLVFVLCDQTNQYDSHCTIHTD